MTNMKKITVENQYYHNTTYLYKCFTTIYEYTEKDDVNKKKDVGEKMYKLFVRYQNRLTSLWVPFHCYLNYPICEKRTHWR